MKILLIDLDYNPRKRYPNLALMKLSMYHKLRGDDVALLNFTMGDYDKVYASCVFPKNAHRLKKYTYNIELGGSGIDIEKKLPEEIELTCPDYTLYNIDYGLGFITRGCIRNCPWCKVHKKEGKTHFCQYPAEFKNPLSNKIVFLDGNFLSWKYHKGFLESFITVTNFVVDFNQGLDIRLVDKENAGLLRKLKWMGQLRFAWDRICDEKVVKKGIETLLSVGVPPSKMMFYILIGFNTTLDEDKYRFEILKGLGVTPYTMLYDGAKHSRTKREFERYGRIPKLWRHMSFEKWLEIRKVKEKT